MRTKTIKVKHTTELGYRLVNAADFDADKHELYVEPKAPAAKAAKKTAKKKPADIPVIDQLG